MTQIQTSLTKALSTAYRKQKPVRASIESLKTNLRRLLDRIDTEESEANVRDHLRDFLNDTWYRDQYLLASKDRTDLVMHADKSAKSPAAVLFEVKRPKNTSEMVTRDQLNRKALQELVCYYLRERIEHQNRSIKTLVVTDIHTWFVFDESEFERHIYHHKKLVDYVQGAWNDKKNTDLIYKTIGTDFLPGLVDKLHFTYFDLRDFTKAAFDDRRDNDTQLVPLFKVLSPEHLLKLPLANDSNSLDKPFYFELLHLIGLKQEGKLGSKQTIERAPIGARHPGSLLENTIATLETEDVLRRLPNARHYGATRDEQLFNVGLELVITWVNRLLFLKLLESQLLAYHAKKTEYRFLNFDRIRDFDELNELFFDVLAKQSDNRPDIARQKFGHIPYLNSSLFEINDLESQTVRVNSLKDRLALPLAPQSVLRKSPQWKNTAELRTLEYLFLFLDAYDFASEGNDEDILEERKTLVNASVLGLIFEKINGYRDGSFFTPGFVTMQMCRATIRRAVLHKFNTHHGWNCHDLGDLRNHLADHRSKADLLAANALVNSLRICDPAVGSGHFLVSALNEIIAVKSQLGLLTDEHGVRLPVQARVENDELAVEDEFGFFKYRLTREGRAPDEAQRVQQTLFKEKQKIIENCLFGVDINPNSVKICRLRLWIELLKNAYYRPESGFRDLETLPNIDINIKQGNSLVARFGLDEDLGPVLKRQKLSIADYRNQVQRYHHAQDKDEKRALLDFIEQLKTNFRTEITNRDPLLVGINDLRGKIFNLQRPQLFEPSAAEQAKTAADLQKLELQLAKKEAEVEEIRSNAAFRDAFEWRFEFPEVLDDEGRFVGFDVVVGNPPYGVKVEANEKRLYQAAYSATSDIYTMFLERCTQITKSQGVFSLIIPTLWQTGDGYKQVRMLVKQKCELLTGIVLPYNVFEDAYVDTGIYDFRNAACTDYISQVYEFGPKEKIGVEPLWTVKFSNLPSKLWENTNDLKISFNLDSLGLTAKLSDGTLEIAEISDSVRGILADSTDINSVSLGSFWKPFFDGKLNRFVNEPPTKFVQYSENLKEKPKEYHWFQGKRILVRRIVSRQFRIMATLVEEEFVVKKDLYIFKINDSRFLPEFVLAILNSRLISFLKTQSSNAAKKDDFTQLTLSDIRGLRIKLIEKEEQRPYEVLVRQILSLKQADPAADTAVLEAEIDQLVYGLYGLTPGEVALVEGRGGV